MPLIYTWTKDLKCWKLLLMKDNHVFFIPLIKFAPLAMFGHIQA